LKAKFVICLAISICLISCDKLLIDRVLGPNLKTPIANMQAFPDCALSAIRETPAAENVTRDSRGELIKFELNSSKLRSRLKGGISKTYSPNTVDITVCGSLAHCQVEDSEVKFVNEFLLDLSNRVTRSCS
jgi:hypothetical protein